MILIKAKQTEGGLVSKQWVFKKAKNLTLFSNGGGAENTVGHLSFLNGYSEMSCHIRLSLHLQISQKLYQRLSYNFYSQIWHLKVIKSG